MSMHTRTRTATIMGTPIPRLVERRRPRLRARLIRIAMGTSTLMLKNASTVIHIRTMHRQERRCHMSMNHMSMDRISMHRTNTITPTPIAG